MAGCQTMKQDTVFKLYVAITLVICVVQSNGQTECKEINTFCKEWKDKGFCATHQSFMQVECPRTCGLCGREAITSSSLPQPPINSPTNRQHEIECNEINTFCKEWKDKSFCVTHRSFMQVECPRTCGLCGSEAITSDLRQTPSTSTTNQPHEIECNEINTFCKEWKDKSFCITQRSFMQVECPRTCGLCGSEAITSDLPQTPSTSTTNQPHEIECNDINTFCKQWKDQEFCVTHQSFMRVECPRTCGLCGSEAITSSDIPMTPSTSTTNRRQHEFECNEINTFCKQWKDQDFCGTHQSFMRVECPRTCGLCGSEVIASSDLPQTPSTSTTNRSHELAVGCENKHKGCSDWAKRGHCVVNSRFMLVNCRHSCRGCPSTNNNSTSPPVNSAVSTPQNSASVSRPTISSPNFQCGKFIEPGRGGRIARQINIDNISNGITIVINNQHPAIPTQRLPFLPPGVSSSSSFPLTNNPVLGTPTPTITHLTLVIVVGTPTTEPSTTPTPVQQPQGFVSQPPGQPLQLQNLRRQFMKPTPDYQLPRPSGNEVTLGDTVCGAALITDHFVITPAHCVHDASTVPNPKIRLGEMNFSNQGGPNSQARDYDIVDIIIHPDYRHSMGVRYNDIALLKTRQTIVFSRFVFPYCLLPREMDLSGVTVVVSGLGFVNDESGSPVLQETELEVLGSAECERHYRRLGQDFLLMKPYPQLLQNRGVICAPAPGTGCSGDSGGPLYLRDTLGELYLVGIGSIGASCGTNSASPLPGLYTDVAHFLDWIDSVIYGN